MEIKELVVQSKRFMPFAAVYTFILKLEFGNVFVFRILNSN